MERVNNMTPMPKQKESDRKPVAKMCSCNRDKILYQCKEKSCVNHLAQPTYCIKCLSEGKHAHFPLYDINEALEKYYLVSTPVNEVPSQVVKVDKSGNGKLIDTLTKAGNL
jgi:hypothetical protein